VDTLIPEELADQLIAVLREGLSNAARHARASKVEVSVSVDGTCATLTVVDDGVGIPADPARRSGLANLAQRADELGGSFSVAAGADGGTVLTWTAPTEIDES